MRKRLLFITTLPLSALALECHVDELATHTKGIEATVLGQLNVEADGMSTANDVVTFSGNAVAIRDNTAFKSQTINYNRVNKEINSPNQSIYANKDFVIRSEEADYSLKKEIGQFKKADYYLSQQQANGYAEKVDVNRKNKTEKLTKATYTTCNRKNPSWHLESKEVEFDHKDGIAKTWHTTLHVRDIPIMYLPYMSFPLDDKRKSGFLFPTASLSDQRGIGISLPYYINIATNQDATITPRIMSKRGFMLGAEYRYLLPTLNGTTTGSYLHNDKMTGEQRWTFKTSHYYKPNNKFNIEFIYQDVSDKSYVKDFSRSLDLSTTNVLENRAKATYQASPNYRLTARVSDWKIVDEKYRESSTPYSILPQLNGYGNWKMGSWTLSSESDITNFDKKNTVSGIRLHQSLSASYLFENSYSFVKPTLIHQFTSYNLRDQASGKPDNMSRSIPTFSLDSGLYFDRKTTLFGRSITQTLSPRLFYLQTPDIDQSDIPDFDSALVTSTYNSLFLNNRFTGKDRIGDANQLTTAVSSTFTDNETGRELAKFSVGQIQYFQDRQVSLNGAINKTSRSNIIAEGNISPNKQVKLKGLIHYDTNKNNTEKYMFGISYQKEKDKALYLTQTYDQTYYKQVDFSGVWRLNDNWRTFWRWNYAIDYQKTIDMMAGVEYADCCWGVRVMASQKRDKPNTDSEPENAFFVEFVLKGLGSFGSDTSSELKKVIPSYQPINYE